MLQERKVLMSPSLKVTQLVTESRLELRVRCNYFSPVFTYLYIYSSDHKLFKIWVYENPSYISSMVFHTVKNRVDRDSTILIN